MLDHPLRPIVQQWRDKIKLSAEWKWKKFGDDAAEAARFYNGPHDFLYNARMGTASRAFVIDEDSVTAPSFMMTVNKAAELVQLFGPILYHKNPIRQVNARKVPEVPQALVMAQVQQQVQQMGLSMMDPMVAQQAQQQAFMMAEQMYAQTQQQTFMIRETDKARADLLSFYLNYTPNALDLKTEARAAIDEALIKGLGCLWTELYQPEGLGITMVGTFYDTVDNLLIDPDAETLRDAKWIAKRCIHPIWQVEQEYKLPPKTLRGNMESLNRYAENMSDEDADYNRKTGHSNDLLVYWKIFSKMGIGGRLVGVPDSLKESLEVFGNFCYIVICDELPYPLNLPPQLIESPPDPASQENPVDKAVQWPTPFWADGTWPFTPIAFHWVPRSPWPMGHLKPAMGELKFLDWVYSFIASKIRISCRDFLAVQKSASAELKEIILSGKDYTLIEIEKQHGTINDVVQFLQHPQFNGSIWDVVQAVERNFAQRTGLSELMYGQTAHQYRSAAEAETKRSQTNIRPDDMANLVEEAMTEVARKEALAARWHLSNQDILPVMGPIGAQLWIQLVESSDPAEVLYQLEYRIEAGSARKPNKDRDAANLQQAMQIMLQPFFQYGMQTGDMNPLNKLVAEWAKAIDLDPEGYALMPPPLPPPMPAEAPPEGSSPGASPAGETGPPK